MRKSARWSCRGTLLGRSSFFHFLPTSDDSVAHFYNSLIIRALIQHCSRHLETRNSRVNPSTFLRFSIPLPLWLRDEVEQVGSWPVSSWLFPQFPVSFSFTSTGEKHYPVRVGVHTENTRGIAKSISWVRLIKCSSNKTKEVWRWDTLCSCWRSTVHNKLLQNSKMSCQHTFLLRVP